MKSIKQFSHIQGFLQAFYFYGTTPSKKDLLSFLEMACKEKKVVRLMYGETYDMLGATIDSLKYYFQDFRFH